MRTFGEPPLTAAEAVARQERLDRLWETLPHPADAAHGDPREKETRQAPISRQHNVMVNVGVRCVIAYLNDETAEPVERNPYWVAAKKQFDELDQTSPNKSRWY